MAIGFLFGTIAIIGMKNPVFYAPGIIFDGRSIIISIAGFIAGPLAAFIAAVIAGAYRYLLGGGGAVMGISVIAVSAILGTLYYYLRRRNQIFNKPLYLYVFGIVVHLCMLALTMALPAAVRFATFADIALPVILIYPAGMLLVCLFLLDQESRIFVQAKYRELVENANSIILRWTPDGFIIFMNEFGLKFFGYNESELLGKHVLGTIIAESESTGRELRTLMDDICARPQAFEDNVNENICSNGDRAWINWTNKVVLNQQNQVQEILSIGVDITKRRHSDMALKASECRQKALLDNIPDSVWIKDVEGVYVAVNDAFALWFGDAVETISGKTDYDLNPPDLAEKYRADDLLVMQSGQRKTIEESVVTHDGATRLLETVKTPFYDESRGLVGTVGIARDITERAKVLDDVLLASQKWRTTFDAMLDPVALLSPDFKVRQCNRAFSEFLGRPFEEIIGVECYRLVHKTSEPFPGCPTLLALGSKKRETMELNVDNKIFNVVADPILDSDDEIVGMVHVMRDITRDREVEQRLKVISGRQKALLAAIPEIIVEVDSNKQYIWANDHAREFFGDDFDGRSADYYFVGEQDTYSRVESLFQGDEDTVYVESLQRRRDGEHRLLGWWCHVLKDKSGNVIGAVSTARDVTDVRDLENQLREKNDELERFIHTVSHDLKSPLVTIRTFLGYLREHDEQGDRGAFKKDLDFIDAASQQMDNMLNVLLELSRLGMMANPSVEISFQDLANEAVMLVAGQIEKRGVQVRVEDVSVMLNGDRIRLVEVLQNLLDNAVKYMGDQPRPLIVIGAEVKNGDVDVYVRDNGIGIEPDHCNEMFDLFKKGTVTSSGAGMGLALVKRIVELHGGKVWAQSEGLGKGVCFWFALPGKCEE